MEERNLEIKVGLLVLVAGALLTGFIFVMGAITFEDRFDMYVDFNNPLWLSPGAVVKISGTKAGKVEEITFMGGQVDPKVGRRVYVRVRIAVAERVRGALRADAQFYIANQGLLGEQYLEIDPGTPDAPPMDFSKAVVGVDPPRLEKFLIEGYEIVKAFRRIVEVPPEELGQLLGSLIRVLRGVDEVLAENKGTLTHIVNNVDTLTGEAVDTLREARAMINPGGKVDLILTDVRGVTDDLPDRADRLIERLDSAISRADRLISRIDTTVDDVLGETQRRQIRSAIANLETVSDRAVKIADDAAAIAADVREQADPTIAQVRAAVDDATGIINEAEEIVRTIRRGEGTVGALIMDEQLFDDLKELIRDLKHNPWKFFWRE